MTVIGTKNKIGSKAVLMKYDILCFQSPPRARTRWAKPILVPRRNKRIIKVASATFFFLYSYVSQACLSEHRCRKRKKWPFRLYNSSFSVKPAGANKMGEAIKTHRKCVVERRPGKRQQYHWKYYPLIEDYMELLKIFQ